MLLFGEVKCKTEAFVSKHFHRWSFERLILAFRPFDNISLFLIQADLLRNLGSFLLEKTFRCFLIFIKLNMDIFCIHPCAFVTLNGFSLCLNQPKGSGEKSKCQ